MDVDFLNSADAAIALGVSVFTLYDWLAQSDNGEFEIRGQPTTISYLQGGKRGQGRIRIEREEVQRLLQLMRVKAKPKTARRPPRKRIAYPCISAKLGLPDG